MTALAKRIIQLQNDIQQLEVLYHRPQNGVKLLAVSKGHTCHEVKAAYDAGLHEFGENYVQEALPKIQALSSLPLCWHFIGPIQSNKTRNIAEHFNWVHSICRAQIATALDHHRGPNRPPLQVCIQVNFDDDAHRSGVAPEGVIELAGQILILPHLTLRGLMCIPKPGSDENTLHRFMQLADLLDALNRQFNLALDVLSMGMSEDMGLAIRAGSTLVRIGRAIFGERHT